MRNLKRLLTMVMAIAMLMSLMVVGAGASSFKDDKDITHKDAVEKMSSLNIINGKGEGNFDPTGMVTRAEMAKMICIALNGGNDPKLSSSSVVTSSFTDTKGHWGEGYVEYCVNLGIVAGLGNNTFGPDLQVTPSQAAKMLLVALGYDATYEKFTGATWALNSNKIAQQKGLYDEIQGIDPNAPMTRDAAAQMINNFTTAPMVKYEFGISGTGASVTGVKQAVDINLSTATAKPVYQTVLNKCYKLITVEGTMDRMTYDKVKSEYGYYINGAGPYYTAKDFSGLFGMNVKLYFKDKENNNRYDRSDDPVYDVDAKDSKIIAESYVGDFSDSKFVPGDEVKFNGVVYDTDKAAIPTFAFVSGTLLGNYSGTKAGGLSSTALLPLDPNGIVYDTAAVRLLDTDNNNKVDKIIYAPFSVEKVTYASADRATFGAQGSKDFKDITVYSGVAKNDIVTFTYGPNTIDNKVNVKKVDIKTGTISGTKGNPTEYQIDGGFYYNLTASTSVVNFGLNDKIDYVQFGGNIYWAKIVDVGATSKDVAMVVNVSFGAGGTLDAGKIFAQMIFADGTKKNVRIIKVNAKDPTMATNVYANGTSTDVEDRIGDMVTYKIDSDGYYELTDVNNVAGATNGNLAGCDKAGTAAGYLDKKVGGATLADDAVVFFLKDTGAATGNDAKVYTGKEVKNTLDDDYSGYNNPNGASATALIKESNGFDYAKYAVMADPNFLSITSKSNYAYLTADAIQQYTNGKSYLEFTLWNGVGEVPKEMPKFKWETTDAATNYIKGVAISYDTAADSMIKNVKLVNLATDAVKGWDTNKTTGDIQFLNTGTSKITSDTKIIYVDSKNTAAAASAEIPLYDGTNLNCRYVKDATGVNLLIVDIKNKITANPSVTVYNANTALATVQNELNEGRSVNFTAGTVTGAGNLTVTGNTTLTLAVAPANTGTITVNNGGNMVVNAPFVLGAGNAITVDAGGQLTTGALTTAAASFTVNGTATVNGALDTVTNVGANGDLTVTGAITTIAANAGTINAQGAITTIAANTGIINASGAITTLTALSAGKLNVKETLAIGTVTGAVATEITVDTGKILTVTLGGENVAKFVVNGRLVLTPAAAYTGSLITTATVGASVTFTANCAGTAFVNYTGMYNTDNNAAVQANVTAGSVWTWNANAGGAGVAGWLKG